MGAAEPGWKPYLSDVLRLPARILALGFAILIPALIWKYWIGGSVDWSGAPRLDADWAALVVATLVFAAGVGLVIMLWWISARFFRLLESGLIDGATVAAIRDLPMGLPEGTVRAVLALIVAMIGLPVLVFQGVLDLDGEIAGYVNGIVAGVFGFYFGTRTSGVPASAVDKIASAQQALIEKTDEVAEAKVQAANATGAAEAEKADAARLQGATTDALRRAKDAAAFDSMLDKVTRHLALANGIMTEFSRALPPEMIPAGTAETLADAGKTVTALRGVAASEATQEEFDRLTALADALTGSASPISVLINKAAPLLANIVPLPGMGEVASLVALLGVGTRLGSSQYQRWRARVLAAPVGQRLVEFGTVTPEVIRAALRQAPLLADALAQQSQDLVASVLANVLASPDPPGSLLAAFGTQGATAPGLVPDTSAAQAGIAQLQQALLSMYSANDIQPATVQQVADALASPALPALADLQGALRGLAPSSVNQMIDAVSGISADPTRDAGQRAAFDALVSLVDLARRDNVDLLAILTELRA